MAQMASGGTIKTGTFTGNRSINATFNVGFEPDIFIILRDSKEPTVGIQQVAVIKGRAVYNSLWFTVSGVLTIGNYSNFIAKNEDEWGSKESLSAYCSYASYSNGAISLSNATNGARCYFIDNEQYSWIAIKR